MQIPLREAAREALQALGEDDLLSLFELGLRLTEQLARSYRCYTRCGAFFIERDRGEFFYAFCKLLLTRARALTIRPKFDRIYAMMIVMRRMSRFSDRMN